MPTYLLYFYFTDESSSDSDENIEMVFESEEEMPECGSEDNESDEVIYLELVGDEEDEKESKNETSSESSES